MKKSSLIIALLFFGISFGKKHEIAPLPTVSFATLNMKISNAVITAYSRGLYDKGGNDTCSGGINLGRNLYANTPTIAPGVQLYTASTMSPGTEWTGATSTYYRLVGTTTATVSVNSSGVVTYVSCGN